MPVLAISGNFTLWKIADAVTVVQEWADFHGL